MNRRDLYSLLTIVLAATAAIGAQGKPSTSSPTIPVAAEFCRRFLMTEPAAWCEAPTIPDHRVLGDHESYSYWTTWKPGPSKNNTTTAGAAIADGVQFLLRLVPGTPQNAFRRIAIDLGMSLEDIPCVAAHNCNPGGRPERYFELGDVQLIAKPLTRNTLDDLPGGLLAMECDAEGYDSILHFTFPYLNTTGHWGLNFNPRGQPESSPVTITRKGLREWRIRATAEQRAVLLGFAHTGLKGATGPSREGLYHVPFEVQVTPTNPEVTLPLQPGC
jgi:hypothetical protein